MKAAATDEADGRMEAAAVDLAEESGERVEVGGYLCRQSRPGIRER